MSFDIQTSGNLPDKAPARPHGFRNATSDSVAPFRVDCAAGRGRSGAGVGRVGFDGDDHGHRPHRSRYATRSLAQGPTGRPEAPAAAKDVWTIRVRLQMEGRRRDLAMFNLAIDSKLKGCDLVRLRIDDVFAGGGVRDRATVTQKKTGRPVQFEITEQTRGPVLLLASGSPPSTLARGDIVPKPFPGKAALVDASIRPHRPSMG